MSDMRYFPANTLAQLNQDADLFKLEQRDGDAGLVDRDLPAGIILAGESGRFFSQGGRQGRVFGDLKVGDQLRRLIIARPCADVDPWDGSVVVEKEFYKPWKQKKS